MNFEERVIQLLRPVLRPLVMRVLSLRTIVIMLRCRW